MVKFWPSLAFTMTICLKIKLKKSKKEKLVLEGKTNIDDASKTKEFVSFS